MDDRDEKIESTSPPRSWRRVRRFGRIGFSLVLAFGWFTFFLALIAIGLEESGWVLWKLEHQLSQVIDPAIGEVRIDQAEIEWTQRTVHFGGVRFFPASPDRNTAAGDAALERGDLELGDLELRFNWTATGGIALEHAVVRGGEVRISEAFTSAVREIAREFASEDSTSKPGEIPTVALLDVDVRLEVPGYEDVQLGRVDASLLPASGGLPRLAGRVRSPVVGEDGVPGYVYLNGTLDETGLLEVHSTARNLPVGQSYLPEGLSFSTLQSLDPRGKIHLDASARYTLGTSILPEVEARLSLEECSLRLENLDNADRRRVENIEVLGRVKFSPGLRPQLWDADAWSGVAQLGAGFESLGLEGWFRFGADAAQGQLADAWLRIPDLEAGDSARELCECFGAGVQGVSEYIEGAYAPGGFASLSVGLRLPADMSANDNPWKVVERAYAVTSDGRTSLAYHGPPRVRGDRDSPRIEGFPLRVEKASGEFVHIFEPALPLPEAIGVFGAEATHGNGPVKVSLAIHVLPTWMLPPETPGLERFEFFLTAESEDLAVDERLEGAFAGLAGVIPPSELWDLYQPDGGELDFQFTMWGQARGADKQLRLATEVQVELDDVSATWTEFPLPASKLSGEVDLFIDGRPRKNGGGRVGLRVDLEGRSAAAAGPVRLRGHVRSDPADAEGGLSCETNSFAVTANGVDISHPDFRAACRVIPDLDVVLDSTGAAGEFDTVVESARALPCGLGRTRIELVPTPSNFALEPAFFPLRAERVYGRAIVAFDSPFARGQEIPEGVFEVRITPLVGELEANGSSVPVSISARVGSEGDSELTILAAGLNVADTELHEALRVVSKKSDQGPERQGLDLSMLEGYMDVSARLIREGQEEANLHFDLFPRHVSLDPEGPFRLDEMTGEVQYNVADSLLSSDELHGVVGSTEVVLTDFSLQERNDRYRLQADISAEDMPLDEEHLSVLLSEEARRALLEDLSWRGRVDIEEGTVTITWDNSDADTLLRFNGELALSDMFAFLGVPVSVGSAAATVQLELEGENTRTLASVRDLYGLAAGRKLDCRSMLVTFVDPRLTFQRIVGTLEGGRLTPIGSDPSFVTVDLEPPYPFWVSAAVEGVEMSGLLRGVFNSDFANKGELSGRMRLSGDTQHLTEVTGSGHAELRSSSLWSIPVFQELFSQLGFDTTATFDAMKSDFRLENGRINMSGMQLDSDLLKLVGKGRVGLDGTLNHDLEVRYSIVDKLGPITWLVYKIQNGLLRVSIRGDMSRPKVKLKGLLSDLLFNTDGSARQLPLPGFSELPARF